MTVEKESPKRGYARWYFPKDWKQTLDGVQRLACLGVAIWYLATTHEWVGCVAILAAGQLDALKARAILIRALKGMVEEKL